MSSKLPFSFEDIDYVSGTLCFYMDSCDDETSLLAHIEYPNNFDIIVEHNNEEIFTVSLYWGMLDHCPAVAVYSTKDMALLEKTLTECIRRAEKEAVLRRFSYYGPLWETEIIEIRG